MNPELLVATLVGLLLSWGIGFVLSFVALRRAVNTGTGEVTARQIVQVIVVPPVVGITVLVIAVLFLGF